jgi:hypothetical protein
MIPEDLLFWIESLDDDTDELVGVLCRRHADTMVVPRGWTLDDRREAGPRLFRPPAETVPAPSPSPAPAPSPARRRRSETGSRQPEQLQIDGTGDLERPASTVPTADEPTWHPTFDHDDDLGGVLEVRSPLLARAFRGVDRPKD